MFERRGAEGGALLHSTICAGCTFLQRAFASQPLNLHLALPSPLHPQLDKVTADAAEFKAGYDKLAVDAVEQKAVFDKIAVDSAEQKAQVGGSDRRLGILRSPQLNA